MREILRPGYKYVSKAINTENFAHALPKEMDNLCETYPGGCLDNAFLRQLNDLGSDVCGENGEYHTLLIDDPIFRRPLRYKAGRVLELSDLSVREIIFI